MKRELELVLGKLIKKNAAYKELLTRNPRETGEILNFFKANEKHHQLLNEYFPASNMNQQEIVKRTANRVGLNLPNKPEHLKMQE